MVLQVLRSRKFARRVMIVLLVLIIPAFVLWGVGSIARRPKLVGKIGKEKIYSDDFAKSRQGMKVQLFLAYYADRETLSRILKDRHVTNLLAWERLALLGAARAAKIRITNDQVLAFVSRHPLFQRNGVFDRETYGYILKNNLSLDPRRFEELVREYLVIRSFRKDLLKDVKVTDEELLEYYKKANDRVELSYIVIDKDLFRREATATTEEAREFYEANKDRFFEPAKVEIEYVRFPYGTPSEKDSVAREIDNIYPELRKSPGQFRQTAEERGLAYGTTGPFSREDVIPGIKFFREFQERAFALGEGEISPPVYSSPEKGACYVLRKLRDIPRRQQDFDEVRKDIMVNIADRKRVALAAEKANELYKKTIETGVTLEQTARLMGLEVKKTGPVALSGYIENIGPAGEIVIRARETGPGGIIPPVTIKKGALLARVDRTIPADEEEFNKKKETLRKGLLLRKQAAAMERWFRENVSGVMLRKRLEEL